MNITKIKLNVNGKYIRKIVSIKSYTNTKSSGTRGRRYIGFTI